jgi:signal transduction histidine kinase
MTSLELLNELAEIAKIGIWEYDVRTGEIIWSEEIYEIHEIAHDVQPTLDLVLSLYTPEAKIVLDNAIQNAVQYGENYDLELLTLSAKNNYIWIRAIGKAIFDEDGKLHYLRGTTQNIHQIKQRELELHHSIDIINDQNKRLNNFAHIVSHNLRTHSGNFEMMLNLVDMAQSAEEREEFIQQLKKVSGSLSQTIDHLSEVLKIQTEVNKAKTSIYFQDIYDGVLQALQLNIKDCNALITADFSKCQTIDYVKAYLESIMLNLLSNAMKYRRSDIRPEILIKTYTYDDKTFMEVKDNGLGINLERHRDKLFGMYKTFHNHSDARGIGLFITKNQVEALGGDIAIESEPGKGTKFIIQF